jgi:hypothetical protein
MPRKQKEDQGQIGLLEARVSTAPCVLRTHPARFAPKFLFIRVIRVIRGFNSGIRLNFKIRFILSTA